MNNISFSFYFVVTWKSATHFSAALAAVTKGFTDMAVVTRGARSAQQPEET
jgi:hypothetical protein